MEFKFNLTPAGDSTVQHSVRVGSKSFLVTAHTLPLFASVLGLVDGETAFGARILKSAVLAMYMNGSGYWVLQFASGKVVLGSANGWSSVDFERAMGFD